MIKISSETRLKLKCVASAAAAASILTGFAIGRIDLPYDPRDIGGIVGATLSAIWLFRPR